MRVTTLERGEFTARYNKIGLGGYRENTFNGACVGFTCLGSVGDLLSMAQRNVPMAHRLGTSASQGIVEALPFIFASHFSQVLVVRQRLASLNFSTN